MLLNCGVGENSWESLGLQGDKTCQSWRKSVLNIHWKDWCWSWNSNTLATWCEELTHWKRPWCWERSKAGREGDDRGWDGWMASPTRWTCVWASSGSWWWTGNPGVLQSMELQRVGQEWVTELSLFIREGNGTPLQYSCLENPMDGGAWKAAVLGVAEGRTRLSYFTFTFMHWRRKWQPTPVFLPGESQGWGSLVGCIAPDKIRIWKDICTPMFIAALFTTTKVWKQPKGPSIDECIKKAWYIYTVEYYFVIKSNEIMPCA